MFVKRSVWYLQSELPESVLYLQLIFCFYGDADEAKFVQVKLKYVFKLFLWGNWRQQVVVDLQDMLSRLKTLDLVKAESKRNTQNF